MAGRGLRAATIVTLVLSFAIVLGLGRLVGPVPSDEPPTAQHAASDVPVSTTAPANPSPEPTAPATAGAATPPYPPSSPPLSTATPSGQVTTPIALEPDANGEVYMRLVQQDSTYDGSPLDPTVTPTDDGRLQVCVHTNVKITSLRQQDWVQIDPPNGDKRCTYVRPGTDVAFRLEPR